MTHRLHASLTPNRITASELLTLQFDRIDERLHGTELTVRLVEVDTPATGGRALETGGRSETLIEFPLTVGASGQITTTHSTDTTDTTAATTQQPDAEHRQSSPTPQPTEASDSTRTRGAATGAAPSTVRLRVMGFPSTTTPVLDTRFQLLDPEFEHGVYEVKLIVREGRTSVFESAAPVVIHDFQHPTANGRPIACFTTGSTSDSFFDAAAVYWEANSDACLTSAMSPRPPPRIQRTWSIEDMLRALDAEGGDYGPWGQINIACHGNVRSIKLAKSLDTNPEWLNASAINALAEGRALTSVDAQTEVVIRACRAGLAPGLARAIKRRLFANIPSVSIPKWTIAYEYAGNKSSEFFMEDVEFFRVTIPGRRRLRRRLSSPRSVSDELRRAFHTLQRDSPANYGLSPFTDDRILLEWPSFDLKRERDEGAEPFTYSFSAHRSQLGRPGRRPTKAELLALFNRYLSDQESDIFPDGTSKSDWGEPTVTSIQRSGDHWSCNFIYKRYRLLYQRAMRLYDASLPHAQRDRVNCDLSDERLFTTV